MAAQPPFMVLHQNITTTNTNTGNNGSNASMSNGSTNFYQTRTLGTGVGRQGPSEPFLSTDYLTSSSNQASGSGGSASGSHYLTQYQLYQRDGTIYPGGSFATASTTTSVPAAGPSSSASAAVAATTQRIPAFRAPAHKHAHHLHSIPPREKSTRTLIIDHMLWVHGRTRFAQARAELGMTDRTGGPSSSNYTHRTRPENYEEEEEIGSEGEDSTVLKARGAVGGSNDRSEEARLIKQDLPLARTLRLRAEGLEKVVTSMLDQPPPIPHHPAPDDHHHHHHHHHHKHRHWGVEHPSPNTRTGKHPHTLPNGVRLRLALDTIVNDLFARQAPHPPYRHTHQIISEPLGQEDTSSPPPVPSVSPTPCRDNLPEALLPISRVSGMFKPKTDKQTHQRTPSGQSQSSRLCYTPPAGSPTAVKFPSPNTLVQQYQQQQQQQQYHSTTGPSPFTSQIYTIQRPPPPPEPQVTPQQRGRPTRPVAQQRALSLYANGADPTNLHGPSAFRCPRHLHTGCEICVEAKSPTGRAAGSTGGRVSGTGGGRGAFAVPAVPSTSNNSGFTTIGGGNMAVGITGWQDGSGMGTGLLKPGVRGNVLRRKVYLGAEENHIHSNGSTPSSSGTSDMDERMTGAGNTKISRLIPRFIKLSALVAGELGREVRGEETDESSSSSSDSESGSGTEAEGTVKGEPVAGTLPAPAEAASQRMGSTPAPSQTPGSPETMRRRQHLQQHQKMYEYALKPTREWYMLLAGLLTRAVLEGYLTAGWRGVEAAECLLLLGLGVGAEDLDLGKEMEKKEEEDGEESEDEDDTEETRRKREKKKKWRKRRRKLEMFDEDEEFSEFHPDEYPSLFEAIRVLFPSLRSSSGKGRKGKGRAEEEFEFEMYGRLKRFYDVPASTPDLSTHMEDLAWQYPAEPIERAAVRFCEAVAKWRGKPELETYKQKPPSKSVPSGDPMQQLFTADALAIESLVHSNPTSPVLAHTSSASAGGNMAGVGDRYGNTRKAKKPSVDVYFATKDVRADPNIGAWAASVDRSPSSGKKRRAEGDQGREGDYKRLQV
ncbi:hypothetical protein FA15DRAFT_665966 [Coprinopsis marcescibilis]|uniref:Uncharacterized protein n=1 Tax=Coprinopsis marcescibilis TaxID=230819 RepID=A0A5C3L5P9_COPMA|nr:hypothetical protein FA15DRAFT_665966 [Coprinopsis marcescibilis]